MMKRLLSLLLTILMLVSLFPAQVLAASPAEDSRLDADTAARILSSLWEEEIAAQAYRPSAEQGGEPAAPETRSSGEVGDVSWDLTDGVLTIRGTGIWPGFTVE